MRAFKVERDQPHSSSQVLTQKVNQNIRRVMNSNVDISQANGNIFDMSTQNTQSHHAEMMKDNNTYKSVANMLKGIFNRDLSPEPAENYETYEIKKQEEVYHQSKQQYDIIPDYTSQKKETQIVDQVSPPVVVIDEKTIAEQAEREKLTQEIEEKEGTIQRLRDTNFELLEQLKVLNTRLDDLLKRVRQKQAMEERTLKKAAQCNHGPILDNLNALIKQKDDDIMRINDKLDSQVKQKEREMANCEEKIHSLKKEVRMHKKKSSKTEADTIMGLEKKIRQTDEKNKELKNEIKQLKKLQHDHGKELEDLDSPDQYPQKIKQLLEEIRIAKERHLDLDIKIKSENKQSKRQQEHLLNLSNAKKDLEFKYANKLRELGPQNDSTSIQEEDEEFDQQELMDRIIQLEGDLQAKDKENQLCQLKLRELTDLDGVYSPRRQAKSATRNYTTSTHKIISQRNELNTNNNEFSLQRRKLLVANNAFTVSKEQRSFSNIKGGRLSKQLEKSTRNLNGGVNGAYSTLESKSYSVQHNNGTGKGDNMINIQTKQQYDTVLPSMNSRNLPPSAVYPQSQLQNQSYGARNYSTIGTKSGPLSKAPTIKITRPPSNDTSMNLDASRGSINERSFINNNNNGSSNTIAQDNNKQIQRRGSVQRPNKVNSSVNLDLANFISISNEQDDDYNIKNKIIRRVNDNSGLNSVQKSNASSFMLNMQQPSDELFKQMKDNISSQL